MKFDPLIEGKSCKDLRGNLYQQQNMLKRPLYLLPPAAPQASLSVLLRYPLAGNKLTPVKQGHLHKNMSLSN